MGVKPESALYIGDTLFDIRAAKQMGLKSAGVSTGYHKAESLIREEPDVFLKSLGEIFNK